MKLCPPRAGLFAASAVLLPAVILLTACSEDPSPAGSTDTKTGDDTSTTPSSNPSSTATSSAPSSSATADETPTSTQADTTATAPDAASPFNAAVDAGEPDETEALPIVDAGPKVTGQTEVGGMCSRAARIGTMGVHLDESRTIVGGAISDAVLPSSVPEVRAESGGCQLLVPRNLFCEACGTDEACAGDNECVPKPVKVSAGIVQVKGLADQIQVSPNGITSDYSKTILEPFPAYEVGAAIEVSAQGDQAQGFTADLFGVPKMTSPQSAIAVTRGAASAIEWDTTDVVPEQSAVFITFSVNVHGAVTGWLECVSPDTGNFEVPEELVTELIDLGLSGFPRADLERRSSATVELPTGCVDVLVASKLTLDIEVDGLTSCNKDSDCDEGQTCNAELACE